jgi:hypothetical protein
MPIRTSRIRSYFFFFSILFFFDLTYLSSFLLRVLFPFHFELNGGLVVVETKVELLSQLQGCDIYVDDTAEEKSIKKTQEAEIVQTWKDSCVLL